MDLGFSVNRGPLSQINLTIISFDSAVHLATGAYGWWKARTRSQSLIEVLESQQSQLSTSTTFNRNIYEVVRHKSHVRGVALDNGQLESLSLPKASTELDGDPGLICLRALVTGLLCLFDIDATVALLTEVIPRHLIIYELQGKPLNVEGPFVSSLRQYVSAVAVEEDSNTLRKHILKFLGESISNLDNNPLSNAFSHESFTSIEHSIIIGVLDWVLTSPHKRSTVHYPTRSLTAWTTALVLAHLGFEISASYKILDSQSHYDTYFGTQSSSMSGQIFLVTINQAATDPLESSLTGLSFDGGFKPRLLPVKAIPWIAFRHLGGREGRDSPSHLSDVWDYSFKNAMDAFGSPQVTVDGLVLLPVRSDHEIIHSDHKDILRLWSPQLWKVLGNPMRRFLPMTVGIADEIQHVWDEIRSPRFYEQMDPNARHHMSNWYCASSIILATVYAAMCKSLYAKNETSEAGLHVEVAFPPDLVFTTKPRQWAIAIGGAIDGLTTAFEWTKMIMEVSTAIEFSKTANPNNDVGTYPAREPFAVSDVFGAQANGVVVISDFLVRPNLQATSLITFHIEYGQCLHFPLDDDGLIRVSAVAGQTRMISLDPDPEYTMLESQKSELEVRIDVKPDWNRDPRKVAFHARVEGVHKYTFSPLVVAKLLPSSLVVCECSQAVTSLSVPIAQRWQPVRMSQLFVPPSKYPSAASRIGVLDGQYLFIQAGGDMASQLLCLGLLESTRLVLATNCLECGYKKLIAGRTGLSRTSTEGVLINGL